MCTKKVFETTMANICSIRLVDFLICIVACFITEEIPN